MMLKVEKTASVDQIRKAYKRLALELHPDKNDGSEEAKANFQKVNEAYQVLSDPQRRSVYDETGCVDETGNMDSFKSAYDYFRSIYKKIEVEDIDAFSQKYRYSAEEEEDLMAFYEDRRGDIRELMMSIPCSVNSDIARFILFYETCIEEKLLKNFKAFKTS